MTARDDYPRYFAEKLWEWLPAVYREQDALNGDNALRAFVESLAEQAAYLKRSQDRLWDDAYVELASDWAIPYLAALVGTRLVSAQNPRARRVDVAKTIYYRRRKGTVAVLEQLIADMAAWDGKVVEEFKRLGRTRHALDEMAEIGRLTKTPEGGWANLNAARSAQLVGTPFDEFHYTPDVRKPQGAVGQRGISKLTLHLYRLQAVEFRGVQPRRMKTLPGTHQGFTFDPSGRDIPLFSRNSFSFGESGRDWASWQTAAPWQLPAAIKCRLLGEVAYEINDSQLAWILDDGPDGAPIPSMAQRRAAADDLRRLSTLNGQPQRFLSTTEFRRLVTGLPNAATLLTSGVWAGLLTRSLVDDCGHSALLADASGNSSIGIPALGLSYVDVYPAIILPRQKTCAGNLDNWNVNVPNGIDWWVQPERGRFLINPGAHAFASIRVRYHVGMLIPLGAGGFGRQTPLENIDVQWQKSNFSTGTPALGTVRVEDSSSFVDPPDQLALQNTIIRAAEEQRPYLRLNNFWRFGAAINNAQLSLDGLWIGTHTTPRSVVLQTSTAAANFDTVHLRFCTLDPGGEDANNVALPPVTLLIDGYVDTLIIENSILAEIKLQNANSVVKNLVLQDSIVHARTSGHVAINLPTTYLQAIRSTVVAPRLTDTAIIIERIDAEAVLVAGLVVASDQQTGCFRFSAAADGSVLPHPYRSVSLSIGENIFASQRFGEPNYLQLSAVANKNLLTGGENGTEIGVYASAILPIKASSLVTKIEEFMPFGRVPNLMIEN